MQASATDLAATCRAKIPLTLGGRTTAAIGRHGLPCREHCSSPLSSLKLYHCAVDYLRLSITIHTVFPAVLHHYRIFHYQLNAHTVSNLSVQPTSSPCERPWQRGSAKTASRPPWLAFARRPAKRGARQRGKPPPVSAWLPALGLWFSTRLEASG